MPTLFKARLAQYGSYVAEVAASLDANSDIVYSPIEPILLPWPWFRGRVVIGGDAAHTSPPHLTQGAAMAAEDGYVLAREMLAGDGPVEARLMRYSQMRYARSAFVYSSRINGCWKNNRSARRPISPRHGPSWRRTDRRGSPPATAFSIARDLIIVAAGPEHVRRAGRR